MTLLRATYRMLFRLHDLWILLAWTGILAAVMLNTFYRRSCYEFTTVLDFTAPCQGPLDLAMIFAAAVGAGIAFTDDRLGFIGFLPAHIGATILFIVVALTPSYVGLIDPVTLDVIIDRVITIALKSQFPFALFFSFFGSLLGLYFAGKLSDHST